jgi:hypothetical protein
MMRLASPDCSTLRSVLKRAPLADYAIAYFATHGLVAGDVKGVAEPSLALSLPQEPSELDDGLLTASEVAELKLNADWVVLSACNTIAGNMPGAETLSGLARAFLCLRQGAAGDALGSRTRGRDAADHIHLRSPEGRCLLVARSGAATGHAGYLDDKSSNRNAYPALWGPLALISEGAAR